MRAGPKFADLFDDVREMNVTMGTLFDPPQHQHLLGGVV